MSKSPHRPHVGNSSDSFQEALCEILFLFRWPCPSYPSSRFWSSIAKVVFAIPPCPPHSFCWSRSLSLVVNPNNPLAPAYILSLTQHENRPGQPPRFEPWSWEAISRNIERERKLSDNSSTSGNNDYRSLGELTMLSRS